ncbi:MAG: tetratricopeptide repeat protein [Bacteroidia bacterium]|nr:tetratricopeptide repeat protein [Bacteroidia bacterium]
MQYKNSFILFFCIVIFCFGNLAQAQSKIDSLWRVFTKAGYDTTRARLYFEIGTEYQNSNPDTAIYFYNKVLDLTKSQIPPCLPAGRNPKFQILHAQTLQQLSRVEYNYKSDYNKALVYSDNALKIFTELSKIADLKISEEAQKGIASCYTNIGNIYTYLGNYSQALEYSSINPHNLNLTFADRQAITSNRVSLNAI